MLRTFLPVSALRRICIDELEEKIKGFIPSQPHLFPDDQITDRSERFLAAEIVPGKNHSPIRCRIALSNYR